jgi:hypothetical protein
MGKSLDVNQGGSGEQCGPRASCFVDLELKSATPHLSSLYKVEMNLFQVKQPVLCPNNHVFCSGCMDVWLQRNKQCPACRTPINPANPVKKIAGKFISVKFTVHDAYVYQFIFRKLIYPPPHPQH